MPSSALAVALRCEPRDPARTEFLRGADEVGNLDPNDMHDECSLSPEMREAVWIERQGMMLCIASKESAALSVKADFFSQCEAKHPLIKLGRSIDIVHEERTGPMRTI